MRDYWIKEIKRIRNGPMVKDPRIEDLFPYFVLVLVLVVGFFPVPHSCHS